MNAPGMAYQFVQKTRYLKDALYINRESSVDSNEGK
jgi:hypothetical protein